MSYSTDFKGELKFKTELTATQLAKVKAFCGAECREHKDWLGSEGLTWVDLELLGDFSGLRWDGSEKTYDLAEKINMITANMQQDCPDFGFTGKMLAQGEDVDDRWELIIGVDGKAVRKDVVVTGTRIECPCCGDSFLYEG